MLVPAESGASETNFTRSAITCGRSDRLYDRHREAIFAPENLAEQTHNLAVDEAIVNQQMGRTQVVRIPLHVADRAAGFGHKKNPGSHIPGIQAEFPKSFEASAGDISQVDSRRPAAPHPMQWNRPFDGVTRKDGVFSSWNGHRPT